MPVRPEGEVRPETVEALLAIVQNLVDEEREVGQELQARASALTGFSGIILSLAGAFGKPSEAAQLPQATKIVVVASFAAGLLLLITSVLIAVLVVLRPRSVRTISISEVEQYPSLEFVSASSAEVRGRVLRGSVTTLASRRHTNGVMGKWLLRAYELVAAGIICIAVESFVLGYEIIL